MNVVVYYRIESKSDRAYKNAKATAPQREVALAFCEEKGAEIQADFTERETKRTSQTRPQLKKALDFCKENSYTLVIPYTGQLWRSPQFLEMLRDSGAQFVCADHPEINNFSVDAKIKIAREHQEERAEKTSKTLREKFRTGDASPGGFMADPSKRGNPRKAGKVNGRRRSKAASEYYEPEILPIIRDLREGDGEPMSYARIADHLNELGFKTFDGGQFHDSRVFQVYKKALANA